jgi:hypothetical protein
MVELKGSVIWPLGGKLSDFVVDPEAEFFYQHDARWIDDAKQDEDELFLFQQRSHTLGVQIVRHLSDRVRFVSGIAVLHFGVGSGAGTATVRGSWGVGGRAQRGGRSHLVCSRCLSGARGGGTRTECCIFRSSL